MLRRGRRTAALLCCALGALQLLVGCSDLLDTSSADAVVVLEAADQDQVLLTRQEILSGASAWGGTRVGEQTTDASETALEFSLSGQNLDAALGSLSNLDAPVVSRSIDVDAEQVTRGPATSVDGTDPPDPAAGQVRLRVEVKEGTQAGAGVFLQLVMAVFSVVGMVATAGWIMRWWRRRGARTVPPRRRIDRVDLRDGPPTEETPAIPSDPWS